MTGGAADPFDASLALGGTGLLARFNRAGVLAAGDVHVAGRLGALAHEADDEVLLAAALAVRGVRLGHVRVDLERVRDTVAEEAPGADPVDDLPWPDPQRWVPVVSRSPLVAVGADRPRPFHLAPPFVYLDRLWRDENSVAADLVSRAGALPTTPDGDGLAAIVARLFPEGNPAQRWAAAAAATGRLAVVGGGPGTGKTTTIARTLLVLHEAAEADGEPVPLVALAAPTGRAAARLTEAVRDEASRARTTDRARGAVQALAASTLHRLLGRRPGSNTRFRHDRDNRLPHDVVVVDETSMVSLALMARLLEALRPTTRLVLVGDPEQLVSIEAGSVLADLFGPAPAALRMTADGRDRLGRIAGVTPECDDPPPGAAVADAVVLLTENHRFAGAQADLAEAIRRGDGETAVAVLRAGRPGLSWVATEPDAWTVPPTVRETVVAAADPVVAAAVAGDATAALDAFGRFRVLCAHRRGPDGVAGLSDAVEAWLAESGCAVQDPWYVGRPVVVTGNDYTLRLFNGDTGVTVARPDGGVAVAFRVAGAVTTFSPTQLSAVATAWAMTVHRAQGSEFDAACVVLPSPDSRVLTRQLLYTAVTRARSRLSVVGSAEAVRAAVARPVARASGLAERLWGSPG